MYRKDLNEESPLQILARSIHGGLGPGNLGVVMAPAGVGKTACLVQIGLDDILRGRPVLHVALGQSIDHVETWYEALLGDLLSRMVVADRDALRAAAGRQRMIKAFADHALDPDRLDKVIDLFAKHASFKPAALLIDGYDWEGPVAKTAAALGAFRAQAKRLAAELWMTAHTHRSVTGAHPSRMTAPCEAYQDLIDVAIYLEPHKGYVDVRLLKDHDNQSPSEVPLHLHCETLRLVASVNGDECDGTVVAPLLRAGAYTLLSGGAGGAENEFGACAERWGLGEETYSFAGRKAERARGLVVLSDEQLRLGDVSSAYVAAHMHRVYPQTPLFRKVLQSIWHQVHTAGEVFVVGSILADKTVKGGTGWAAQLARHFAKPVHVFDDERRGWWRWAGADWVAEESPRVTRTRFAGTGTRFLSDDGRAAIHALFERSFGPAPR